MVRMAATSAGGRAAAHLVARCLASMLLVSVAVSACGGDPPSGDPSPGPQSDALEVEIASGLDALDAGARSKVQNEVGDLLSSYVVHGFLGDYPREDFVRSLDAFTGGAAEKAARDIDVLTASRFSDSDGVRATKLLARIACLTSGEDVVGATAHISFAFEASEGSSPPQPITLEGRLMLIEDEGEWSIFGYDVTRDDAERVGQ